MHYIPFNNEDPKNSEFSINCKCCPLCIIGNTYNEEFAAGCPYCNGNEIFSIDKEDFFTLSPAKDYKCKVRWYSPLLKSPYIQLMIFLINDSDYFETNTLAKYYLDKSPKRKLYEGRDKDIQQIFELMKKLYPDLEDIYNKIMFEGYKLDDNMNLYQVEEKKEEEMSESVNGLKREVVMFCKPNVYDNIKADKEITSVCGIELNHPTKNVYDDNIKTYYHFMRSTPEIDMRMGESDIIIVNNSQFTEDAVEEKVILESIANIIDAAYKEKNKEES